MAEKTNKFSRRTIALFLLFAVGILIAFLVAYQQIAVLYVAATISLVILLIIVAFSDLENVGNDSSEGFAPKSQ